MVFMCKELSAQNFMTEIVINGNIAYLDNQLNIDQIINFRKNDLCLLRNTIYAKYGYKFISNDLTNHFSQFSWYEGTKINVETELTSIDWENIRIISMLENYYSANIDVYAQPDGFVDYVFSITKNGIYSFDEQGNFLPIFVNNTNDVYNGSFVQYQQFENILFFENVVNRKSLVYDLLTQKTIEVNMHIIHNIQFISKNILSIVGLGNWTEEHGIVKHELLIDFEYRNTADEIIGKELVNTANRVEENIYAWYGTDRESINWRMGGEGDIVFIHYTPKYDYPGARPYIEFLVLIELFNKDILINYVGYLNIHNNQELGYGATLRTQYNSTINKYIIIIQHYWNDR
jgi:hypothetical protein